MSGVVKKHLPEFARRLRKLRRERGWNQADLGAELAKLLDDRSEDFKQATVSRWERGGMPRPGTIEALAKLFGCSVDHLLGGTAAVIRPGDRIVDLDRERQYHVPRRFHVIPKSVGENAGSR